MIEPTISAQVATTTTTSVCARRSGETPRSASASAIQAARPSSSWARASTCVSTASTTPMNATIASVRVNGGTGARARTAPGASSSSARPPRGLRVAEVAAVLVPGDLEQPFLDAVVEPGAAEDELAQPVDERLALEQADALPVADEVAAERAAGVGDPAVGGELDEVGGLLVVEVVRPDQPEPDGRRGDPLLEVVGVEAEAVAEELDHVLVAGRVVRLAHLAEGYPPCRGQRLVIPMIFVVLAVWLVGTWVTKFTLSEMAVFTPIAVVALGAFAGVILLWVKIVRESLRARAPDRASPTASRDRASRTRQAAARPTSPAPT